MSKNEITVGATMDVYRGVWHVDVRVRAFGHEWRSRGGGLGVGAMSVTSSLDQAIDFLVGSMARQLPQDEWALAAGRALRESTPDGLDEIEKTLPPIDCAPLVDVASWTTVIRPRGRV